jgi:integration host factor subunit alpha
MELSVESMETPALTKAHLADLLFEQIGLNKRESKDMVEAFFTLISDKLIEGEDVKISSFGNFQIRTKAPRPGRNPRTGDAVSVRAKAVPFFKSGKELRERLNLHGDA